MYTDDDDFDEHIDTGARRKRDGRQPKTLHHIIEKKRKMDKEKLYELESTDSNSHIIDRDFGERLDMNEQSPHQQIDLNVTINRPPASAPVEISKKEREELKYQVLKHVETDRNLYFVRLVAGYLKRTVDSMIEIEDRNAEAGSMFKSKIVVKIKYTFNNELLHSWATVVEKIKLMLKEEYRMDTWRDAEEVNRYMIAHDSTCVAFARYVAFFIMTESNNLIPRGRTRYMMNNDAQTEDRLVVDLMRALYIEYPEEIRRDIVQNYL